MFFASTAQFSWRSEYWFKSYFRKIEHVLILRIFFVEIFARYYQYQKRSEKLKTCAFKSYTETIGRFSLQILWQNWLRFLFRRFHVAFFRIVTTDFFTCEASWSLNLYLPQKSRPNSIEIEKYSDFRKTLFTFGAPVINLIKEGRIRESVDDEQRCGESQFTN